MALCARTHIIIGRKRRERTHVSSCKCGLASRPPSPDGCAPEIRARGTYRGCQRTSASSCLTHGHRAITTFTTATSHRCCEDDANTPRVDEKHPRCPPCSATADARAANNHGCQHHLHVGHHITTNYIHAVRACHAHQTTHRGEGTPLWPSLGRVHRGRHLIRCGHVPFITPSHSHHHCHWHHHHGHHCHHHHFIPFGLVAQALWAQAQNLYDFGPRPKSI